MFKVKLLMILQSKCLCQDVFQWLNLCVSISLCVIYQKVTFHRGRKTIYFKNWFQMSKMADNKRLVIVFFCKTSKWDV